MILEKLYLSSISSQFIANTKIFKLIYMYMCVRAYLFVIFVKRDL